MERNYLKLRFFTDYEPYETKEFGAEVFDKWFALDKKFHPEEFQAYEGAKNKVIVERDGINFLKEKWVSDIILGKRKSEPKYRISLSWLFSVQKDIEKGSNFPIYTGIYMSLKQKENYIIELFKNIVTIFKTKFAETSSNYSLIRKYEFHYKYPKGATSQRLTGHGVRTSIATNIITLPLVTWINYYGSELVNYIGEEKFKTLNTYKVEKFYEGYLVMCYPSHKLMETEEALEEEEKVMQHLGKHHFFDRSKVDIHELFK
ncbi:hypothetical protein GCL60_12465 [Silvanigrella paludirubra]|uniref:DUF3396 domain-containing protein n=1 Tax=Silvanigrella paludirubra TaxID=2499159 RepID=A0A6N6VSK0_9BACT|nr:hypothetical protein [Silvanigrella paludirubra]KAB8037978.1 hypothetical protein GCL60_12465 [Silvanigrella paludirubra]